MVARGAMHDWQLSVRADADSKASATSPIEIITWFGDSTVESKVWVTNCTFVGDTQPGSMGLRSRGGKFCLTGAKSCVPATRLPQRMHHDWHSNCNIFHAFSCTLSCSGA